MVLFKESVVGYNNNRARIDCIAGFLASFCCLYITQTCCCTCLSLEGIAQGKVNGEFRIRQDAADPGTAAIFANYPAPYSSASIGLVEEVSTCMFRLNMNMIISFFYRESNSNAFLFNR